MRIRKLSPLLVNQIAAGEVIERPASVVRELVDNALDAEATAIDVRIEDGGRRLVRVADDGGGIPADQLPAALAPHATSKIAEAADLAAIRTLGFRGEALASIASVARLRLTSRLRSAEAAAVIEAGGEKVGAVRPAAAAPGTVVEVRDLFFNTPARRKFLRAASTEFGHIHDAVARTAMARPGLGFRLMHHERRVLDLPPGQSARRRCLDLLGEELADGLLEFESNERGVRLWGLAGVPSLARATTRYQYLYVNGRPVRDRHVLHAMKEAYRGLIEPARQPLFVLFIRLDPAAVDVNVHPAKAEVRFADTNLVHGQVLAAVRQRLLSADLTPAIGVRGPQPVTIRPAELPLAAEPASLGAADPPEAGASPADSIDHFVDYFRRMDPKQKGFVYEQVRREMAETDESANGSMSADHREASGDQRLTDGLRPASSVLQVHNSYIVTQDEQGIVIIDQHALHERMMFETLYQRIRSAGRLESQRLITPATLNASPERIDLLERLRPLLERIGVEAEAMGPRTIAVQAFPTLLFDRRVDPAQFIEMLLDRAAESGFEPSDEAALHEALDMMSCRAAVKAGDAMRPEELSELIRRRDQIERAGSCPHGRPTTIRLTLRDLEKHFKRV